MACKGTKVSPKEAEKMWKLYQELGSYKLVAKKLHRDADTVSRHVRIIDASKSAIYTSDKSGTTIIVQK